MTTKRSDSSNPDFCQFPFADGRRCRMLRHKDHPSLCLFHARDEQQFLESQHLGAELAVSLSGDFFTATDVNHVLGKVFSALAQDRIPLRKAVSLAYLGQLLLQSIPAVKSETKFHYTYKAWQEMFDNATYVSSPSPNLASATPQDQ
jgi:hypothetical protein